MDKIGTLESLLTGALEIVLFKVMDDASKEKFPMPYGVAVYNSLKQNSDELEQNDCEYGDSLEEAIDKAIKRWS